YSELVPIPDKTAETVASAFREHVVLRHTCPRVLLSDNGSEFINGIMQDLCSRFNIHQAPVAPHHPASNGLAERTNRKVLEVLRVTVNPSCTTWDEAIPDVQCTLNSSLNSSIGETPHFALYGYDKR
ncbi:hypothetical protein OTU49_013126, partial [Cherax quadricarinatus]